MKGLKAIFRMKNKLHFFPPRPPRPLRFTLLLAVLSVSACGWRLQGAYEFPPVMAQTWLVTANPHTEFIRGLTRGLEAGDVTLVADPTAASATLHILVDRSGQRVLSVSTSGRAREYQVYYQVVYELRSADAVLIPRRELELTRNYLFDEADLLAKNREGEVLREALQQDMVRQVLRQLNAATNLVAVPTAEP